MLRISTVTAELHTHLHDAPTPLCATFACGRPQSPPSGASLPLHDFAQFPHHGTTFCLTTSWSPTPPAAAISAACNCTRCRYSQEILYTLQINCSLLKLQVALLLPPLAEVSHPSQHACHHGLCCSALCSIHGHTPPQLEKESIALRVHCSVRACMATSANTY